MTSGELGTVEQPHPSVKMVVSFPVLLTVVLAVVTCEAALVFLLPHVTRRYEKRISRATQILQNPPVMAREMESLRMIPPSIGVIYRRQLAANARETDALFSQLLLANDSERQRLIQQGGMSHGAYLAVLRRSYGGSPAESRLEEFLIQNATAIGGKEAAVDGAWLNLQRNYLYAGERAQYAGLIDEARRAYRRFVDLGRMLNRKAGLEGATQWELDAASVRLKVLSPEHAFATLAMRAIQEEPATKGLQFVNDPDPRLAALARYNAASSLWHEGKASEANKLLTANDCGVLTIECKFLRAKILDEPRDERGEPAVSATREGRFLLEELIRELPDDHPLLDDIYFHRALVENQRENKREALAALSELEKRCPHTDLVAEVARLRDDITGRPADE